MQIFQTIKSFFNRGFDYSAYYQECVQAYNPSLSKQRELKGIFHRGILPKHLVDEMQSYLTAHDSNWNEFVKNGYSSIYVSNSEGYRKILDKIWTEIIPYVNSIYQSYSKVQEVKVLRHHTQTKKMIDNPEGAFVWHSDGHPDELINILVYLNNVSGPNDGCFQYLIDDTGRPVYVRNKKNFMKRLGNTTFNQADFTNYVAADFVGESGSFFIFDNNFLHRAAPPVAKKRDVILFQVRPSRKSQDSIIDWKYLEMKFADQMKDWYKNEG